ncbi:MAG: NADPH-dependent FMN reductase [Gemmatimonas sp.]
MRVFVTAASLRRGSWNRLLATIAADIAAETGDDVDLADFASFAMPLYDGDVEASAGLPDGARALSTKIKAADAIVLATPEYNNSVPGPLKNAIDWLSREKPYPTAGRPFLLLAASSGRGAGLQGMTATRIPLAFVGAHVYPTTFGVGSAATAFSDDRRRLRDADLQKKLETVIREFLRHAAQLSQTRTRAPA